MNRFKVDFGNTREICFKGADSIASWPLAHEKIQSIVDNRPDVGVLNDYIFISKDADQSIIISVMIQGPLINIDEALLFVKDSNEVILEFEKIEEISNIELSPGILLAIAMDREKFSFFTVKRL